MSVHSGGGQSNVIAWMLGRTVQCDEDFAHKLVRLLAVMDG